MLKFYCIDTETSGLSTKIHEITEISTIRCDDKVQLTNMVKCDYPQNANVDALRITGKTLADLEKGISKRESIDNLNKFLKSDGLTPSHRCIIGHNINFDLRFLHKHWSDQGEVFPANLWLDTISLTKEFIKKQGNGIQIIKTATGRMSTTLHSCCDMVGIKKFAAAHNSKVDSRNTYLLWKALVEEKGVDYLPFIKTQIHYLEDDERIDPSTLDD
jgi:DNA polymerase III epsilon subunit-like protein